MLPNLRRLDAQAAQGARGKVRLTASGGGYLSDTHAVVAQHRLLHRFTRPYTPKTNGKAERFIQTSLREWAYAHAYSHSDQRSQRLPFFLHNYNWHRPHSGIGGVAPMLDCGKVYGCIVRISPGTVV